MQRQQQHPSDSSSRLDEFHLYVREVCLFIASKGAIMWHYTHATIHLIELIIDARREDGIIYSGLL